MSTATTSALPPLILQHFDSQLLTSAFGLENPEYYRQRYASEAQRRYKSGSRKMREFDKTLQLYEEIYEWKKTKEAYEKAADKAMATRPIIPYEAVYSFKGELGRDLRAFSKIHNSRAC